MVTAIFPAAGQGKRMKASVNKVFLELMGKPILVHTLLAFSRCDAIDNLIVVVGADEVTFIKALLTAVPGLKPYKVIAGSTERQYSIFNGLAQLSPATDVVLVHDGARPLVSCQIISAVVEEARKSGAAIAAVPAKDTIKIVDKDELVEATPDRQSLWTVQTPQGFTKEVIVKAYQQAANDEFLGTDDSSLVERIGVRVKVVQGDYSNIKVTTPEDLLIAEAFMRDGVVAKVVSRVSSSVSGVVSNVKEKIFRKR